MLFNLGFTADAAAAHRHEFSQPEAVEEAQAEKKLGPAPPLSAKSSHHSIVYSSSDEGDANNDSVTTPTSTVRRPAAVRKRSARPKTVFQFAHPVATSHRRLTLRPKLLLQLHESSQMSRPFPKYDVLPAAVAPRLACKFPKLFASLRGLGPRDLVIVTSDMYEQHGLGDDDRSISSEDSSADQREVVATICVCQPFTKDDPPRSCKVEIVSSLGVSWEGSPLPNGSYELVCKGDQQRRKVRWVARDRGTRRVSSISSAGDNYNSSDFQKRFTFSVLDPNSRRHPVLASMTRNGIDVFEQYSYPPAPSSSDDAGSPPPPNSATGESRRELINLEEELRVLIVTSGIWIAFVEGWAKNPTTLSDIGPLNDANAPARSGKSKKRHSMAAETHDQKWTTLDKKAEPGEEDNGERPHEDDPKMKGKSWRRFSSIFGRRKR
ncbi:hypothetical protein BGW36DRAFT_397300 [Talaromyces proteolyticus]|uniref:Uncharacterized protein n=1 Tax=Talaromyces proteolyticus TaxID=1131652 RepID=A0AAD4PWA5_9EURO|nr:uncharacterized protein BGW36DRAFT_397300 [Talaromyces proteolyticus]KAH8697635.1 hypothetical protein BGW36DRAFT_397300 [Talaromyces proteolyticus]